MPIFVEPRAEMPIGLGEIAETLGVPIGTLGSKRSRGGMPPPDGQLSEKSMPWWYESSAVAWVKQANYVPADIPDDWESVRAARAAQRALRT